MLKISSKGPCDWSPSVLKLVDLNSSSVAGLRDRSCTYACLFWISKKPPGIAQAKDPQSSQDYGNNFFWAGTPHIF